MKISSVIAFTLFVGATSIIAGTLLMPRNGSKRKNKFARKGQELKDYIVDNYNDLSDAVTHPFENLEDETIRLRKKANAKMREVKAEVDQKLI